MNGMKICDLHSVVKHLRIYGESIFLENNQLKKENAVIRSSADNRALIIIHVQQTSQKYGASRKGYHMRRK